MLLAYCDYISHVIRDSLIKDPDWQLAHVGNVQWDLDKSGAFNSTTKVLIVEDNNGKKYKITVEEV